MPNDRTGFRHGGRNLGHLYFADLIFELSITAYYDLLSTREFLLAF